MTLSQLLFTFEGRLNRKAYWFAVVVLFAAGLAGSIVDWILFGTGNGVISLVIAFVSFVASIAVAVKRWHDRDKSGWWVLIVLVPLIGWIWTIVENGFLRGTPGPNRFGPGVPRRKPFSTIVQIQPISGTSTISTHHPDLSRSCHRFTATAMLATNETKAITSEITPLPVPNRIQSTIDPASPAAKSTTTANQ